MPSIGDFMVAFSAWIMSTGMPQWALALQKTALSDWIAMTPFVIPTLQTIHIYAVSMLFTGFLMMNVRIFMIGNKSRTLAQTMDRFMPWIWWCLLVLLITGVL